MAQRNTKKISLFDIWSSYKLHGEDWEEAWLAAGLAEHYDDLKLTDAQFNQIPYEDFYRQDLKSFNEMKADMALLIQDARNNLSAANEIRQQYAEIVCNERGLYK